MKESELLRELADELDRPASEIKLPSGDITIQEAMRRMRAAWPTRSVSVGFDAWDYTFSDPAVKWNAYVDIPTVGNQEGKTLREAVEKMERLAAEQNAPEVPVEVQLANADEVIAGSTDTAIVEVTATERVPVEGGCDATATA